MQQLGKRCLLKVGENINSLNTQLLLSQCAIRYSQLNINEFHISRNKKPFIFPFLDLLQQNSMFISLKRLLGTTARLLLREQTVLQGLSLDMSLDRSIVTLLSVIFQTEQIITLVTKCKNPILYNLEQCLY